MKIIPFFRCSIVLWQREVVRFFRQRSRVIGTLATPLMFWFVIGGGLGKSFADPGQPLGTYFEYFFPGSIVLSVLFTAIFSTISVIEDRHQGFLQGVLVSPAPRAAIVFGKILGGGTLGLIQGLLLLSLSPLVGISLDWIQISEGIVLLFLMATALTGLGFFFAWKIDSVQGYHSIMNTVMVPLWLLSGAVFPLAGAHEILFWIGRLNPLSYAVQSFREILFSPETSQGFLLAALLMLAFTVLFTAGNTRFVAKS